MREDDVLDALAVLLEYPGEGHAERALAAAGTLARKAPGLAPTLEPFLAFLRGSDAREREELYTRTFDWSSERSLDLGWHLYGEQYERGAFLVRLRDLLRRHGVEEGAELPDHLGTVLRLVGRMEPPEAAALSELSLRPALARLKDGFGTEAQPYLALIASVEAALPASPAAAPGAPR